MTKAVDLLIAGARINGHANRLLKQDVALLRKHGATEAELMAFAEDQAEMYGETCDEVMAELKAWMDDWAR